MYLILRTKEKYTYKKKNACNMKKVPLTKYDDVIAKITTLFKGHQHYWKMKTIQLGNITKI